MEKIVVVKTFSHMHEAEMAKDILRDKGIECIILSEAGGGDGFNLKFGSEYIRLSVQELDFERAQEILKIFEQEVDVEFLEDQIASKDGGDDLFSNDVSNKDVVEKESNSGAKIFAILGGVIILCVTGYYLASRSNNVRNYNVPETLEFEGLASRILRNKSEDSYTKKLYYPNGNVYKEGYFTVSGNSISTALITEYYENGNLKSKRTLNNGELNGWLELYFSNGNLKWKGRYKDGKKQGKIQTYHEHNGNIQSEQDYKDNLVDGWVKYYHYNGKLQSMGRFVRGRHEGLHEMYDPDGSLEEELIYRKGQLLDEKGNPFNGIKKTFYESGALFGEWPYEDGELTGNTKEYYESGNIMRERKVNGLYKTLTEYYETGVLRRIYTDKDGKIMDEKEYDENGNLIFGVK